MVESPQRIWIEADDECPYFYEADELHDVEQDVIEYVRADLYAALESQLAEKEAENERLKQRLAEFMRRLGPRWFLEQGWFPESMVASDDL